MPLAGPAQALGAGEDPGASATHLPATAARASARGGLQAAAKHNFLLLVLQYGHQRRCLRISASSHAQVHWFPSCLLCENTAQAGWRAGGAPVRLRATARGGRTAPEPSREDAWRRRLPASTAPRGLLGSDRGGGDATLGSSGAPAGLSSGVPQLRGGPHSGEHPCHGAAPRPQGKVNARRRGALRSLERELCVRARGGFSVPPCMLLEKQRAFFEPWCPCCGQGSPQSPPGAAPRAQGTRQCEELSTGALTRPFLQLRRTGLAQAQGAQRGRPSHSARVSTQRSRSRAQRGGAVGQAATLPTLPPHSRPCNPGFEEVCPVTVVAPCTDTGAPPSRDAETQVSTHSADRPAPSRRGGLRAAPPAGDRTVAAVSEAPGLAPRLSG